MSSGGGTYFAHPTAVIENGAVVGPEASVWHHAHIRAGAVVGGRTVLGKDVYVDAGAVIGAGCKVQNGVSVYAGVVIEDDVFVGPGVVFTNDLTPRASGDWVVVPTLVREGASVGANATIVCGTTVGSHAMVGAGAVVVRDVADHELVLGNPARHAGWVCRCGRVSSRDAQRPADTGCDEHRGGNS